jgi:hypothetical protein
LSLGSVKAALVFAEVKTSLSIIKGKPIPIPSSITPMIKEQTPQLLNLEDLYFAQQHILMSLNRK